MANAFKPTRQRSCDQPLPCSAHPEAKPKAKKNTCPEVVTPRRDSALKLPDDHDGFNGSHRTWRCGLGASPLP